MDCISKYFTYFALVWPHLFPIAFLLRMHYYHWYAFPIYFLACVKRWLKNNFLTSKFFLVWLSPCSSISHPFTIQFIAIINFLWVLLTFASVICYARLLIIDNEKGRNQNTFEEKPLIYVSFNFNKLWLIHHD